MLSWCCNGREFSGQSAAGPQRSAHSLGGLPVGGLAGGRGAVRGERGLSATKASGLSSSKKRGDAMRRSVQKITHLCRVTNVSKCRASTGLVPHRASVRPGFPEHNAEVQAWLCTEHASYFMMI